MPIPAVVPTTRPTRAAATPAALVAAAGLVLALALSLVAVAPATSAHAAGSATRAVSADFDSQVLHYTNVERTKRGLRALEAAACVDRYAARQASRTAAKNRMFHQPLRPVMRGCHHRTAGENLAWRAPSMSAQQVVRMWMGSPGHRRNILNGRYKYLGVDAVKNVRTGRVYAAQVFGG